MFYFGLYFFNTIFSYQKDWSPNLANTRKTSSETNPSVASKTQTSADSEHDQNRSESE